MNIHEPIRFGKDGEVERPVDRLLGRIRPYFVPALVLLAGLLGLGVGYLSAGQGREAVKINYDPSALQEAAAATAAGSQAVPTGQVFASSKGAKYYYPGCSNNISPANKITFSSSAAAEQAGYTLAANCHQ